MVGGQVHVAKDRFQPILLKNSPITLLGWNTRACGAWVKWIARCPVELEQVGNRSFKPCIHDFSSALSPPNRRGFTSPLTLTGRPITPQSCIEMLDLLDTTDMPVRNLDGAQSMHSFLAKE